MKKLHDNFENISRIRPSKNSNPIYGKVKPNLPKILYYCLMLIGAIIGLLFYTSAISIFVFLITTILVLLLGHSVGMHRCFIHNSFQCPKWLEYLMVYMGVMVGLGGPFTMIKTHDFRDWAQRQNKCHSFFSHQNPILQDAIWQIFCKIELENPPEIIYEPRIRNDKFYDFIEKYSALVHLPVAMVFYIFGGIGMVLLGVCLQIIVTVFGHWVIGYHAHITEPKNWWVKNAAVQGNNVRFFELITMGEAWHNNHHAFPSSAKLGLEKGQADPGWWFICALQKLGLAKEIILPENLKKRDNLVRLPEQIKTNSCPIFGRAMH